MARAAAGCRAWRRGRAPCGVAPPFDEPSRRPADSVAEKQGLSRQLKTVFTESDRLANVVREALKAHYGIRAEKLVEFGMQPFRGRKLAKTAPETPGTPQPPGPVTPQAPGPTPAHPTPTLAQPTARGFVERSQKLRTTIGPITPDGTDRRSVESMW